MVIRKSLAVLLAAAGLGAVGMGAWIPAKAALGQVLLERAWERVRAGAGAQGDGRPWPWADTEPVARLRAPGAGTSVLVLAGASGRTLAWGPGHLPGTARPGAPGNAVVVGHRDTHFAFLEDLRPGDPLEVEGPDGRVRRYRVERVEVVPESDTRWLRQWGGPVQGSAGDRVLTLVTCYPFDAVVPGGPLRFVARARGIDAPLSARPGRPGRRDPGRPDRRTGRRR